MKNEMPHHKALCVLNFSGSYGGAEKRYATLFNQLMEQKLNYYLIINRRLYSLLANNAVLVPHKRIIIFNDKKKSATPHSTKKIKFSDGEKKSRLRLFLGRWKYFLSTLFLWVRFSMFFIHQLQSYQFVKIYGVWQGGIWSWMHCKLFHIPLVYSVNASGTLNMDKRLTNFFNSQFYVLKYADALDFLSPSLEKTYRKALGTKIKGKTLITPNSFIDYTQYYPIYPKEPWVVFLGRLEPLKNPILFLKAVEHLLKDETFQKVTFFIMGTGNLKDKMLDSINTQNHKNIVFTGMHPHPWEVLRQSSVFVSLQTSENYPSQSLIEAMACENGVVVTDVGDTQQLVSKNEGILVNQNHPEIANAIGKLLTNPELREKLGKNARQKVLQTQTLESFVKWFDQIMNSPSKQNETI